MKRYIKSAVQPISDMDREVRRELAEESDNSDILSELVRGDDYDALILALKNPNLSIADMYTFAEYDWDYRMALAENPNLPDELLYKLLNDEDEDVYKHFLWNPRLPESEVERLVEKLSPDYTQHITIFDETKPIVLERLSKYCTDGDTLENIARNPHVSPEILDRLSYSKDVDIRCRVAINENISQETIKRMLSDPDVYVRECLVANPSISKEDREILARDPSARVRRRAELYIQEYAQ